MRYVPTSCPGPFGKDDGLVAQWSSVKGLHGLLLRCVLRSLPSAGWRLTTSHGPHFTIAAWPSASGPYC